MSSFVQMLWGERRGRATFGAVQRLPMELPMSHQDYHFDASRSLTSLEQDGTIIAVIEADYPVTLRGVTSSWSASSPRGSTTASHRRPYKHSGLL